jgi:hypothetical protein
MHKCAWIVHNLVNQIQLKTTQRGIKQIIELILEVSHTSVDVIPWLFLRMENKEEYTRALLNLSSIGTDAGVYRLRQ